jgi:hypothetical protein
MRAEIGQYGIDAIEAGTGHEADIQVCGVLEGMLRTHLAAGGET